MVYTSSWSTTPGDFEVSPSAKHGRLLKINRFKNLKIKLQERNKYLKKLKIQLFYDLKNHRII